MILPRVAEIKGKHRKATETEDKVLEVLKRLIGSWLKTVDCIHTFSPYCQALRRTTSMGHANA